MEHNEFDLVSTSNDLTAYKRLLTKAGIKYVKSERKFYKDCIRVQIDTMEDMYDLIYALEEDLILRDDATIEIYDSYRE